MRFKPGHSASRQEGEPCFWMVFYKDKLLVNTSDKTVKLPLTSHPLIPAGAAPSRELYLGELDGYPCIAAETASDENSPADMAFIGLRRLYFIDEDLFRLAGRASQMIKWDRTHQYCGQCGTKTLSKSDEPARVCLACGLSAYPRISPAVMAAVPTMSGAL